MIVEQLPLEDSDPEAYEDNDIEIGFDVVGVTIGLMLGLAIWLVFLH